MNRTNCLYRAFGGAESQGSAAVKRRSVRRQRVRQVARGAKDNVQGDTVRHLYEINKRGRPGDQQRAQGTKGSQRGAQGKERQSKRVRQ